MKTKDATKEGQDVSDLGTVGSQRMGSPRKQASAGLSVRPPGAGVPSLPRSLLLTSVGQPGEGNGWYLPIWAAHKGKRRE